MDAPAASTITSSMTLAQAVEAWIGQHTGKPRTIAKLKGHTKSIVAIAGEVVSPQT